MNGTTYTGIYIQYGRAKLENKQLIFFQNDLEIT